METLRHHEKYFAREKLCEQKQGRAIQQSPSSVFVAQIDDPPYSDRKSSTGYEPGQLRNADLMDVPDCHVRQPVSRYGEFKSV